MAKSSKGKTQMSNDLPKQLELVQPVQPTVQMPQTQVVERITDADRLQLEGVKQKRELAIANAKTAVAQSETADALYNNVVLRIAMTYRLVDGDVINENGEIQRKSQGQ